MKHKNIELGLVHTAHNWEYADEAARLAATDFIDGRVTDDPPGDLGKLALQLDDNSLWILTAIAPTWAPVGSAEGATATSVIAANAVALGEDGARNLKGVAGITTDGTSRLQLGVEGGAVGGVELRNATTGTASIVPPTGALGTAVHTLPSATGTLFSTTTKADAIDAACFAADAGSNDTYVATLSPAITAYVTGAHYRFKANTANTGAATINFNSLGAKTIKKAAGGITTDLADNDIRAGQWVDLVYDGTNMQMQSSLGNTPAGFANPMTTAGDTIVGGSSGAPTRLAIGSALQVRRVNAAGTAEEFVADIKHFMWSFNPKAVCDGTIDRLFLMTVGPDFPSGFMATRWNCSFDADPATEADLDLKRADAFIGVANSAVMDVLDTTSGASSETTAANINSGSAVANGKVMYLEFGTAYTADNLQIIFELWGYAV